MPSSIGTALKGPGLSGQSRCVRFNTHCSNDDFLADLAAALCLSQASLLGTVSFTSLGEAHGHAAMPNKLRKLLAGEDEGPELGLQVVEGELRVQVAAMLL